jgi:hypothetical protein
MVPLWYPSRRLNPSIQAISGRGTIRPARAHVTPEGPNGVAIPELGGSGRAV